MTTFDWFLKSCGNLNHTQHWLLESANLGHSDTWTSDLSYIFLGTVLHLHLQNSIHRLSPPLIDNGTFFVPI